LLDSGIDTYGRLFAVAARGKNQDWDWDIFLFSNSNMNWRVALGINLKAQKARQPNAKYVPGPESSAVVIEHHRGSGTGFLLECASWFLITDQGSHRVCNYPSSFHYIGYGPPFQTIFKSETRVLPTKLEQGAELRIAFQIHYSSTSSDDAQKDVDLFSEVGEIRTYWDSVSQSFVARQNERGLPYFWYLLEEGEDEWRARNLARLNELSVEGNSRQQAFVQRFLVQKA
jgi:hypothetical protein